MLYIVVAIIMFSLLIAVHEFGHFFTAKLFGIRVNEFAIGMGPAILKKEKGETLYSLRLFPIGGFCAMEGEDEDSDDPRAFGRAAVWKQTIVLVAGAAMNFLVGFLLVLALFSQSTGFLLPTIAGFSEEFGIEECGLQAGDVVYSINNHRVYYYSNLSLMLSRTSADDIDWVVKRDGEKLCISTHMPLQEVVLEDGRITYQRGLLIGAVQDPATPLNIVKYSWYGALDFVRLVWMGLGDLISGAAGLRDLSGPVGIVSMISEVGSESPTTQVAIYNIVYFAAMIAVNLAVMNLLPIPALDGGRIFFLVINAVLYALFRKKIDPKYESYVHIIGLALLLSLSVTVTVSDVGKLFGR